jgi:hypothetical protein
MMSFTWKCLGNCGQTDGQFSPISLFSQEQDARARTAASSIALACQNQEKRHRQRNTNAGFLELLRTVLSCFCHKAKRLLQAFERRALIATHSVSRLFVLIAEEDASENL